MKLLGSTWIFSAWNYLAAPEWTAHEIPPQRLDRQHMELLGSAWINSAWNCSAAWIDITWIYLAEPELTTHEIAPQRLDRWRMNLLGSALICSAWNCLSAQIFLRGSAQIGSAQNYSATPGSTLHEIAWKRLNWQCINLLGSAWIVSACLQNIARYTRKKS